MHIRTAVLLLSAIQILVAAIAFAQEPAGEGAFEPNSSVDPFIGTGGLGYHAGSAYPGATLPFGFLQLSPDTTMYGLNPGFSHCAGYYYLDPEIRGFSHTHLHGTGISDLAALALMPIDGRPARKISEKDYRSRYSHTGEKAEPGYYAVYLQRSGTFAELTTARYAAYHRYTWRRGAKPYVVINPSHVIPNGRVRDAALTFDPVAGEVSGQLHLIGELAEPHGGFVVYFAMRFSRPPTSFATWRDGVIRDGSTSENGDDIGALAGFAEDENEPLVIGVGISYQSIEQARANLGGPVAACDFDTVRERCATQWRAVLNKAQIAGATLAQRRMFFTALYHAYLMPNQWSENNGRYFGFDGRIHDAADRVYYTNFSLWDTFRTLHPLLFLLAQSESNDMMQSLVWMAEQGGAMPMWPLGDGDTECMVGASADIVLSEAYQKIAGHRGFDVETAWRYCRAQALGEIPHPSRRGISHYIARGYVPADRHPGAATLTLEYAWDDFALSRWAALMNRDDDARLFAARSRNWRNLWDRETRFLRGRDADGSFHEPFYPKWVFGQPYVEGTAYQWSWYAPHDMPGLIDAHGSPDRFVRRLNAFFRQATREAQTMFPPVYYWHGNEPDIFAPYMFALAGRPDLTQKWVRWVMDTKYSDRPDGLDGNDDAGTLSAWYIFSAMGLMPLAGSDLYVIGSPLFTELTMELSRGTLRVVARNNSPRNVYVESVTLNGEPLRSPVLRHAQIAEGGILEFVMSARPTKWGQPIAVPTEVSPVP